MRIVLQLGTAMALAWTAAPAAAQSSDPNAAACMFKTGDEAIAACTAAIQSGKLTDAGLSGAFFDRAAHYNKKKDYGRAIADFSEVIRLNPQYALYAWAFYGRGRAYSSQKDYARAIVDFSAAIRLKPNNAYYFYGRGLAKAALGQSAESKADMDRALAIDPKIASKF